MSKKTKKAMSMLLVVTLIAVIAIGGMLAYLTSEDSDVNVMTLGNVSIEQHEYERMTDADGKFVTDEDGYVLKKFKQNKPLYPSVGEVTGWDETVVPFDQIGGEGNMQVLAGKENVQDKFVVVKNTGKSDAYIRTFIAYECGSKTEAEWENLIMTSKHNFWDAASRGVMTIDGNNYVVVEYVYNRVLAGGETSRNSLAQVYMYSVATNEDVEALDGNNNGTYDILALSQAVQTEGFADAQTALNTSFGNAAAGYNPWEGKTIEWPNYVYNFDELTAAIEMGGKITLGTDIEIPSSGYKNFNNTWDVVFNITENTTIDLNGFDINVGNYNGSKANTLFRVYDDVGTTLTIKGDGDVVVDRGSWITGGWGCTVNINGGNWVSTHGGNDAILMWHYSNLNISGGTFQSAYYNLVNYQWDHHDRQAKISGGSFANWDPANTYDYLDMNNHSLGKTMLADGYTRTVETVDGVKWYTVVAE